MRFLIVFLALALLPVLAFASQATMQADQYLKSLSTMQARFSQVAADGTTRTGTFYLDRPGKLRFEYDPPVKDFIVADGVFIYFYDAKLKQQTNAPIGETLADFLLRKNIGLGGDVTVVSEDELNGYREITIVQKDSPENGTLTLGFTQAPFQIAYWRVVDATGATTNVTLSDIQTGIDFKSGLFAYHDPNPSGYNR
ncbi:MAG: outer membrane lipoprotein carrier protein LolA [Alphaproteobacteria bacterium]|nr:outer membrane lipoprotein carrier protein LolA [Alphaproteobacteria bacterium]